MHYVIAFQVLCGFFSAFVAGRKGRSRMLWWCVGALLPGFGVALAILVPEADVRAGRPTASAGRTTGARAPRKRPRRCCGSYLPDCFGCPYFRRHLFDSEPATQKKGYCEFFGKDLVVEPKQGASRVTIEDN